MLGDGRVDDLAGSSALSGGLIQVDGHAACGRDTVIGQGDGLLGGDGLKGDGFLLLAAGAEQEDESTVIIQFLNHIVYN